jgi:SMODS and SLOG-associating 2TM effector domain 1
MAQFDAKTETPHRRRKRERPPRGWSWRCFRDRPLPEDARDPLCTECSNEALRWYCVNLAYYRFQRDWNRGLYRFWQVIVILSAASIPVLIAMPVAVRWVEAIPAAITAAGLAFITLFGWREDYQRFTRTVAELRIEAAKWKAKLPPYIQSEAENGCQLVTEVNRIVENEFAGWQPEKELKQLEERVRIVESGREHPTSPPRT